MVSEEAQTQQGPVQLHPRCRTSDLVEMVKNYDCWVFDCDGEATSDTLASTPMSCLSDACVRMGLI